MRRRAGLSFQALGRRELLIILRIVCLTILSERVVGASISAGDSRSRSHDRITPERVMHTFRDSRAADYTRLDSSRDLLDETMPDRDTHPCCKNDPSAVSLRAVDAPRNDSALDPSARCEIVGSHFCAPRILSISHSPDNASAMVSSRRRGSAWSNVSAVLGVPPPLCRSCGSSRVTRGVHVNKLWTSCYCTPCAKGRPSYCPMCLMEGNAAHTLRSTPPPSRNTETKCDHNHSRTVYWMQAGNDGCAICLTDIFVCP